MRPAETSPHTTHTINTTFYRVPVDRSQGRVGGFSCASWTACGLESTVCMLFSFSPFLLFSSLDVFIKTSCLLFRNVRFTAPMHAYQARVPIERPLDRWYLTLSPLIWRRFPSHPFSSRKTANLIQSVRTQSLTPSSRMLPSPSMYRD